uniref:Ig-like domain-containing protein n=1 Tax=Macrostomum lignano TaxID=282301 RepID=A0A1I8FI70_9PLAT
LPEFFFDSAAGDLRSPGSRRSLRLPCAPSAATASSTEVQCGYTATRPAGHPVRAQRLPAAAAFRCLQHAVEVTPELVPNLDQLELFCKAVSAPTLPSLASRFRVRVARMEPFYETPRIVAMQRFKGTKCSWSAGHRHRFRSVKLADGRWALVIKKVLQVDGGKKFMAATQPTSHWGDSQSPVLRQPHRDPASSIVVKPENVKMSTPDSEASFQVCISGGSSSRSLLWYNNGRFVSPRDSEDRRFKRPGGRHLRRAQTLCSTVQGDTLQRRLSQRNLPQCTAGGGGGSSDGSGIGIAVDILLNCSTATQPPLVKQTAGTNDIEPVQDEIRTLDDMVPATAGDCGFRARFPSQITDVPRFSSTSALSGPMMLLLDAVAVGFVNLGQASAGEWELIRYTKYRRPNYQQQVLHHRKQFPYPYELYRQPPSGGGDSDFEDGLDPDPYFKSGNGRGFINSATLDSGSRPRLNQQQQQQQQSQLSRSGTEAASRGLRVRKELMLPSSFVPPRSSTQAHSF